MAKGKVAAGRSYPWAVKMENVMRFNLVLFPVSDIVNNTLIQLASETSSHNQLQTHYLLKDRNKLSIPHVSVIQFEFKNEDVNKSSMDEKRLLKLIWEHALFVWQELTSFNPELVCSLTPNINYKDRKSVV